MVAALVGCGAGVAAAAVAAKSLVIERLRLWLWVFGLPGGDRTPDPQLRRLMLYPTELRADTKKAHLVSFFVWILGRSTRIRTLDPLVPNQVRYQTAPHSEINLVLYAVYMERFVDHVVVQVAF